MQFALMHGMFKGGDNYSDFQSSTNYECVSDFLEQGTSLEQEASDDRSYTRMITCVRSYKKMPGLFDSMVIILNHTSNEIFKSTLTIAGAAEDQIMSLNRKFAEVVQ